MLLAKALVLAREIGRALGGEQQEAIEEVCRTAELGRRPSQQIEAVGHFRAARDVLDEAGEKKK